MAITTQNFNFVRSFVSRQAAIVLEEGKEYLVESRLGPLAREEGFECLNTFIEAVRSEPVTNGRHTKIVDALTTNETLFFRDHHPFEALRKHLIPELILRNAPTRTLTIWSAASSTGQEPYSIGMMLLKEFPELASWNVKIVATDLSQRVLDRAISGRYTQFEVNRGLPAPYLIKFFRKDGQHWCINDDVKRMIEFKQLNLLSPWAMIPRCDVVFIRNVLIYFDVSTKREIFSRMKTVLTPEGCIFLGGGETIVGIHPDYHPVPMENATAFRVSGPSSN